MSVEYGSDYEIPLNKPFFSGRELQYITDAVNRGKISGNGFYTKRCAQWFEKSYGLKKALMTTSCTDALEMCALLLEIKPNDEVIMPSFTFVSTANAFILRGAKIIFADSTADNPCIDCSTLESLITPRTRAIVVVHYGGISCDMDMLTKLAAQYKISIVEDAAHAIDAKYNGRQLGTFGTFGTFSFHETKNISCGEGGLLAINDESYASRAEIIWEKGTNRAAFFRGETAKYQWVDIGSSFLPSELNTAFLLAQLESLEIIQKRRKQISNFYRNAFLPLEERGRIQLPSIPSYAEANAHLFYLLCQNQLERDGLISYLSERKILSAFHYLPLHISPFYQKNHDGRSLPNAERFSECLIRLPLYYEITQNQLDRVIKTVNEYFS